MVILAAVSWWTNRNRGFEHLVGNGQNALASEDWARARDCFGAAIEQRPQDASLHQDLGYALLRLERFDEAATAYERSVALDAARWQAWRGLGWTRQRQGRQDDAVRAFLTVIRLQPEQYPVYFELAEADVAAGRVDEAVEVYRRYGAARLREDAWGGLFGKGDLEHTMIAGYMTSFDRILKLRPDDAEAHYYVALALLQRDHGPGDEVREHLAALERQADSPLAVDLAAKLEAAMERER
jgi:tetratricopeptide (TPR) repeat protein